MRTKYISKTARLTLTINEGKADMIRLRPFKKQDSQIIAGWPGDEKDFMKWCAGMYKFPMTAQQLCERYEEFCRDDNAWFMTALDDSGKVCGHFIFRKADCENNSIHLGFIIIPPELRGKGFGKKMLLQALKYAFEIFGVKTVTLGVFANNKSALECYKAAGFIETDVEKECFEFCGEKWDCINMKAEVEKRKTD